MIKTFATTIAASALMMGAAFAQTDPDEVEFPVNDTIEVDESAMAVFADDGGMMRDFDDFAMMYTEADEATRSNVKRICEAYAGDDTVTSPRVRNRCLGVIDQ